MNLGKVLKNYQMGGKVKPSNSQEAVDAYTNEAERLKKLYAKKDQSSDSWLDIPQKTAMMLSGLGYQKPSDFLYAHGLRNIPLHEEAAFIADLVADPLNLIPALKVANLKKGTVGSSSLLKGLHYLDDAANIDEVYNYGKKKASQLNNWLGETTGYKFPNGGIMKNYGWGGDLGKLALDTMMSPVNAVAGQDLWKPKYDTEGFQKFAPKYSAVADGISKIGLNVGLGMLTGGVGNVALGAAQTAGKAVYDGATNEQFMNVAKYGGLLRNYQMGGNLPQNILPQNPNDLQAITENTMEFNGNSHKSGGIPLNNGAELEKDETVIKQGAIGNSDPYAISPNLILDRETAKLVGLPSKYAGMKLSDISRKIEDMKSLKENDVMSEKTNSMNKKFALNRLIKANELLSAQHRQEQGVNEMSDLRQEEMSQMQLGGKMPEDFMEYYTNTQDYLNNPDQEDLWLKNNPDGWQDYMTDYNDWRGNSYTTSNVAITADRLPQFKNILKTNPVQLNIGAANKDLNISNLDIPNLDLSIPKSKQFNLKDNLGNIGMGLKGASLLANFATIGKKPGQIPAQFNPYATDILNNYRNTIDNQAIKNDVTSVLNTGLNANPSRNWNVQRATNAELTGKAMEAMSKANLQNQEANNRYRSELGNVENNLGVQNVQAKNMAEVLNAQTQANWRNNLRSAIGNVGNDVADMTLKKDYLNKYTDEHIKILNEKGKDYGLSFKNTTEYLRVKDHPEGTFLEGKVLNKTATPEEIQRLQDIKDGKAVDYTKK